MSLAREFTKGIWKENAVFKLLLGMCPLLAVTTSAENGLGMGIASTFVLVCSNIVVAILRKLIPSKVRIPAFIIIIATFVTVVQLCMEAWVYG
ncbi:MAG: electron transport complex subunit RsxE, partial [Desulfuromonas sp.]